MIAGIEAFNGTFLTDLSAIENRITEANKQLSSGVRVNQASDDPGAVASIIEYQGQLDHLAQTQTNLSAAQTEANSADGALQQASALLDQLASIAAQGASSTATASSRALLGQQVQQIEQQLVDIADTAVNGRYTFGGDSPGTQPYSFDWTQPEGSVQNSSPGNTSFIQDAAGNQLVPRMTAQQIFDPRTAGGAPAPGNIFATAYSLGQALLSNDQPGIQAAVSSVQDCVTQLGQATTFYGTVENWITQAQQTATTSKNDISEALGSIRDADIATVATQLSLEQVSLQAALSAHGNLNTKSLFSYLG